MRTDEMLAVEDMQDKINRLTEQLEEARKSRDATSLQWAGEWKKQYETETRLRSVNAVLRRALTNLTNSVYELDMREAAGNINFAVLELRHREARAALARATEQPASAHPSREQETSEHEILLLKWSDVLDIQSGRFVNDDLKAAADEMLRLRTALDRAEAEKAEFGESAMRACNQKNDELCDLRAELAAMRERIRDAELALTTWDDGHNSEYWLRHAPTPPTAAGEGETNALVVERDALRAELAATRAVGNRLGAELAAATQQISALESQMVGTKMACDAIVRYYVAASPNTLSV